MNWINSIFRGTKKLPPFDLSQLKVDMHSHLIPGIDDGSKSIDDTIAMLAKFESLGFSKVITTPHIMHDYFRNTPEIIRGGLEKVREEIQRSGLTIQFEAAAEYYFDETLLEKLEKREPLLTFGDKYLLFEFSFHVEPSNIEKLFFELITQGYKPVLAHFERYEFLHGSIEKAKEWRAKGINIQLNYNSLVGHYGPNVLKQARLLVDSSELDFVSTDCHRMEHLMILEKHITDPYFHKLGELNLRNASLI
jgi:tyrosine-protein phosphatase YwqE